MKKVVIDIGHDISSYTSYTIDDACIKLDQLKENLRATTTDETLSDHKVFFSFDSNYCDMSDLYVKIVANQPLTQKEHEEENKNLAKQEEKDRKQYEMLKKKLGM